MAFPSNPTNGDTHTIGSVTWTWNGYAWDKQAASGGVSSFAGFTGAVAAGVTTNQVLFHDGTGISGTNDFLWEANVNHPHAEVDIEGKLLKAIKADEALAALDPVYITGNVGASDRVTVAKADASNSAKMPAAGIVTHSFSTNDEGYMVVTGLVRDADTSGFTANDTAYVAVGGGITAARPSGTNVLIQNLGRVGRVHDKTGTLLVLGAGRANDTPNLIHARAGISADAGITFSDGTHQTSGAGGGGIRFTFEPSVAAIGSGEICITAAVLAISETTASGLDMTPVLQDFQTAGGGTIIVCNGRGDKVLYVSNTTTSGNDQGSYWRYTLGSFDLINDEANMVAGEDVFLTMIPFTPSSGGASGVTQSIGFILDGNGSPLGTGDKLDALRQIPYDSYVLNTSAYIQDGVTGAGNEISFGIKKTSALSGSITGTDLVLGVTASAEQTGFTFAGDAGNRVYFRELASVSDTSGSTVDANEWIFPEITGNSGDINKLQIFMTVVPTS